MLFNKMNPLSKTPFNSDDVILTSNTTNRHFKLDDAPSGRKESDNESDKYSRSLVLGNQDEYIITIPEETPKIGRKRNYSEAGLPSTNENFIELRDHNTILDDESHETVIPKGGNNIEWESLSFKMPQYSAFTELSKRSRKKDGQSILNIHQL